MNRFSHRAFIFLAVVAFLTVSTAAQAHGHQDGNSANESHCAMCMAAHGTMHLIAAPPVALNFAAVQVAVAAFSEGVTIAFSVQFPIQDRAPPLT